MKTLNINPQKHIIVCCNSRETEDCCQKVGGEQIYHKLKQYVKDKSLVGRIWVTRARCLGFCNPIGTTIVIYPDKIWLTEVTEEDLEKIIEMINL
jgi:(2Fe-2S) ferredoxin